MKPLLTGAAGVIAMALIGSAVWPQAPTSAIFGMAIASWLIGAALGAVITR